MAKKILLKIIDDTRKADAEIRNADISPAGGIAFDMQSAPVGRPRLTLVENWEFLPVVTTVVATSAKYVLVTGTGAVSADVTRATKGGLKCTMAIASDTTILNFQAGTPGVVTLSASNQVFFKTQVSLSALAGMMARFGLVETPSTTLPNAIAGAESVQFVFDYANTMTTGLAAAVYQANWLIVTKSTAGGTVFTDSGIPVITNKDFELLVQIGTDLKARYYINGTLVRTSVSALTTTTVTATVGGLSTGTGDSYECRYVEIGRQMA